MDVTQDLKSSKEASKYEYTLIRDCITVKPALLQYILPSAGLTLEDFLRSAMGLSIENFQLLCFTLFDV